MICSTCGREIVDESKFCTYCGAHVELAPAQEPTTPAEPAPAQEPTIPVESVPAQEPTAPAEFAGTPDTSSTVDSSVQPQGGIFSPPAADPYTQPQTGTFAPPAADPYTQPQTGTFAPPVADPYAQPQAGTFAAPTPYAQSTGQNYAPPTGAPQGGSAYPPGSGQGYAPPTGAPQAGSAYPPATGQGYAPPAGAPPTGSAYPPSAGQPPKKKTGLIIGIIVAVVLIICVGVGIGGFLIYQGLDSSESPASANVDIVNPNSDDSSNRPNSSDSNDNNNNRAPSSSEGEIVLDNDVLTFIVDTGGGTVDSILDWYEVNCVIVNKTDKILGMYFDYDTTTDNNLDGDDIIIFPAGDYYEFLPNETIAGTIVFDDPAVTSVTNLRGTFIVYDLDTFETLGEYPVSIAKL